MIEIKGKEVPHSPSPHPFHTKKLSSLWKREGGRDFWKPFSNR